MVLKIIYHREIKFYQDNIAQVDLLHKILFMLILIICVFFVFLKIIKKICKMNKFFSFYDKYKDMLFQTHKFFEFAFTYLFKSNRAIFTNIQR